MSNSSFCFTQRKCENAVSFVAHVCTLRHLIYQRLQRDLKTQKWVLPSWWFRKNNWSVRIVLMLYVTALEIWMYRGKRVSECQNIAKNIGIQLILLIVFLLKEDKSEIIDMRSLTVAVGGKKKKNHSFLNKCYLLKEWLCQFNKHKNSP